VDEFVGKGFRLKRNSDGDGELSYTSTVRIASIEAAERA
jgi:hypothetical protein